MEPEIVRKPAFVILGIKQRGENQHEAVSELWERFISRYAEIEHVVQPVGAYVLMGNYAKPAYGADDCNGEPCVFDCMVGVEVDRVDSIPQGMEVWKVPEQTYAAFRFPAAERMETYEYVYEKWLPASDYRLAAGPEFEFYPPAFDLGDMRSGMWLYVPVKKRTEAGWKP